MAIDKSLYVEKKIPTFSEYAQRRMQGESYDQILAQTIQERREYHESIPGYYDVPAYTEATRGMPEDELITDNTTEGRLAREKWLREWQRKRAEEEFQAARNTPGRRANAGSKFWEGLKSFFSGDFKGGFSEMREANEDAAATVNWQGRDKLIEDYQTLQRQIETDERKLERGQPVDAKALEANRQKLSAIRSQLEEKDAALGNGVRGYSLSDKVGGFFGGVGKGIAYGLGNLGATAADFVQEKIANADALVRRQRAYERGEDYDVDARLAETYNKPEAKARRESMYSTLDAIKGYAEADTQRAKGDLGLVGQTAVDIGQNVVEIGFDAGVAALTGGSALVPMFARVAGESAGEARQEGATLNQQMAYGLTKGAIEVATEKMFDGVARVYGEGAADEVVEKLIRKLSGNDAGRTFLRALSSGIGEGAEEVVSDLLSPVADKIYKESGKIELSELLYDFFIGATVGLIGDVRSLAPTVQQSEDGGLSLGPGLNRQANEKLWAMDAGYGSVENQVESAWDVMSGRVSPEASQKRAESARQKLGVSASEVDNANAYRSAAGAIMNDSGTESTIRNAYKKAGIELDDRDARLLAEGYVEGGADLNTYILGSIDAYKLGKTGMFTAEQAAEASEYSAKLDPVQFKHAFSIGADLRSAEAETVDKNTPEGKTRLEGALASLGAHAEAAAEVYDGKTDVSEYAAAMNKAATLYAANGTDPAAIAAKAQAGETTDIIGKLTDAQLGVAMEIGTQIRAERQAKVKASAERLKAIRAQAVSVADGGLAEVNKVLSEARAYAKSEQGEADRLQKEADELISADDVPDNAEELWNKATSGAAEHRKNAEGTQKTIKALEEKRKELQEKQPTKRKKGTVSFDGGTIDGKTVKGVDQSKLNRQQKKVVAMVERLADLVNIDYVFFDGPATTGGAYISGGTVYININAGLDKASGQTIAGATLSHELTHFMQEFAPEDYAELKNFIVSSVLQKSPAEFNRLVNQQRRWEPGISYDEAADELVANACQTMLLNDKFVKQMARENMTLAEKVADVLEDITTKIREAFDGLDPTKDERPVFDAVRAVLDQADEIAERWSRGMAEATENYNAVQTVGGQNQESTRAEAQMQKIGVRADGIEVYETSEETKALSWKERNEKFLRLMQEEYSGRTARFRRNGHTFLAKFESEDIQKNIFGDKESDKAGHGAKINAGADGDIFDLVENAEWFGGEKERGKRKKAHKGVKYWDYFIKTVQIDGKVFDLLANVRQKAPGSFVYNVELFQRKDIEAALPQSYSYKGERSHGAPTASDHIVTDSNEKRNTQKQFIGENARTADISSLNKANVMLSNGDDAETVRKETGWYRGKDGLWRFEIDDSDMTVRADYRSNLYKQETEDGMKLKELINHDTLFDNYPAIKDIDVSFDIPAESDGLGKWSGWHGGELVYYGHISLSKSYLESGNEGEMLDTLAHELQHAVQDWEGFARGSSPKAWERRIKAGYDNRSARAKKAALHAEAELRRIRVQDPDYYRDMSELLADEPTSARGKILDWDTLESEPDPPEWEEWDAKRDALEEKYGDRIFNFFDLWNDMNNSEYAERRSAYDLYRNTAGEIEARDATKRRTWSEEQRRATPPDIGNEDTVFAERTQFQKWNDEEYERVSGGLSEEEIADVIKSKTEEQREYRAKLKGLKAEYDDWTNKAVKSAVTMDEYKDWLKSSGYEAAYTAESTLDRELHILRDRQDEIITQRLEAEERAAIEKSGLSEAEYFGKQAVKTFGYTPYYYDAGYITPNGKMLNFSGEKGMHFGLRGDDHRAIGQIFANTTYTEAMIRFMGYGNIRIMAEAPGLDIIKGVEPTAEQYKTIRAFARNVANEEYFNVDFTDERGNTIGSLEYDGTIRPDRIVNDIKYFFQTGEVRETGLSAFYQTWEEDTPISQEISSAATSINANKLPVLYTNKNAVFPEGGVNIDVGGGRFDNVTEYLAGKGVKNYIFDPYNRDEQYNRRTLMYLTSGNMADTATCSNCLNVIREPAARANVILECAKAIKPDGKAYFTVYEGDGSGEGKVTKSGWQENRKTASYVSEIERYFGKAVPHGKIIVAENPKANLPKAAWELTPGKAVRYQRWDNTTDDTATEAEGREIASARIQSEDKLLSDMVKELRRLTLRQNGTIERLQNRLRLTKTPEVRSADAAKMARQYIRDAGSSADTAQIAQELKAIGDYLLQTKDINEEKLRNMARSVAAEILENASEQVVMEDETLTGIRETIKGKKLTISPDFFGELDGGFDAFRKRAFGKLTLASAESTSINHDEYMSVSQFYADMHNQYGEFYFPDAANEGEEAAILLRVMQAATPMEINPFDNYMGEAVESMANQIVFDAVDGVMRPTPPTDADKAKTTREALKEQIKTLEKEKKISYKEARDYESTIEDLTLRLDRAESRFQSLRASKDSRIAQVQAEGRARTAEVKAKERAESERKIKALKEYYQRTAKHQRELRESAAGAAKYRKTIQKKAEGLRKMLVTNSDKMHVPELLKAPLGDFLAGLDFSSKSMLNYGEMTEADKKFHESFRKMLDALSGQQDYFEGKDDVKAEDLGGYMDISKENLEFLANTANMIHTALNEGKTYTINRMNTEELRQLADFLSNLTTAIKNLNVFLANSRFESIGEAARGDMERMKEMGVVSQAGNSGATAFTAWVNGTPYYVFKRYGKGGEAVFEGFTKGWEQMAFDAKEIIDFTDGLYSSKEANEWKKHIHEIELSDGQTIRMTTAQIMELSMLLNREQALKHIEHGGIQLGDIETRKGKIVDPNKYHLTAEDITNIVGKLTTRQADVAKALQQFMATRCAEWGNEVSMRRFGYKFYTEGEYYYPIKTVAEDRPMSSNDNQNDSMFRLLNLSSSKSLNPKASNALVVGSIFETFSNHTADMAKLHGMGLPILDAIKWFNYKEKTKHDDGTYDVSSVQNVMRGALGDQATRYFRTLMKDINGTTESGDRGTDIFSKTMSNYKAAAVAANLRVALLQPTSYVRAAAVIDMKHLIGIVPSRKAYAEAMKYSGTAVWKSQGYYDTDIARGMRSQIQHDETVKDKIVDKSMILAEFSDKLTWSMLWQASKRQARANNQNLSGEDLNRAAADIFRETIYATQVMDSTLTRSEFMRSKSQFNKAASAFMAEPTLSYNLLMDAYSQYRLDARQHGKGEAWTRNAKHIGRAFAVYVSSAAFSAFVESLVDALRDDDDDPYWDKFLEAFLGEKTLDGDASFWERAKSIYGGNLGADATVLGKLPWLKNIISMIQGYSNKDMAVAAFEEIQDVIKIMSGEGPKSITRWGKIYKALQAGSHLTGFGVSNFSRDAVAVWNAAVAKDRPEWRLQKYEPRSEEGAEKYIQAVTSGDTERAERILGRWEDSKKAQSAVKSAAKKSYVSGKLDEKQVRDVLESVGVRTKDADKLLQTWGFEREQGWEYSDLKEKYLSGEISRMDALKYLTTTGGKTAEKAKEIVDDYDFEKKYGPEFSEHGLTVSQAKYYYSAVKGNATLATYAEQVERYGLDRIKAYYGADGWKATGLTLEQYDAYAARAKECKGTDNDGDGKTDRYSVKNQLLPIIDAMPVSSAVKDAIYRKNNWSERDLAKAPWH